MLDDFIMIRHKFSEPITVIPVADVHLGAIEHNSKVWDAFCHRIQKAKNTYIMLVGDLINNSIRNSVANPFDEVLRPREQKKIMVEHLAPIKDKILCAVSGNHERRTIKDCDIDLTYDIMSKLDIEHLYRENVAFVKIGIGEREYRKGTAEFSFAFAVTHGTGGGIYTGATVNRGERFGNIIDGLDCLVTGHTHKGTITKPAKIVFDTRNEKVSIKPYAVVTAESWLNYGGYAARGMMLPTETCCPQEIELGGGKTDKKIKIHW